MTTKRHDESEVVFEYKHNAMAVGNYPYIRTIIVHIYGSGDVESSIKLARKELSLGDRWEVTGCTK